MEWQNDIDDMLQQLQKRREELQLQLHLASMDAQDEWHKAEKLWVELNDKAEQIRDQAKDVTEEVAAASIVVGEELDAAYKRILSRLHG